MKVFVPQVLAMGAHTTLMEHKLVINHYNNGKSLRELAILLFYILQELTANAEKLGNKKILHFTITMT
jgi:hypothetical protein